MGSFYRDAASGGGDTVIHNFLRPQKGNAMVETSANVHWLSRRPIELAVDSEYQGPATLTVQFAARDHKNILALKLYRSQGVRQPRDFKFSNYAAGIPTGLLLPWRREPPGLLKPDRSPLRVLKDLFKLEGVRPVSRAVGYERLQRLDLNPPDGTWSKSSRRWRIPEIEITLVGHFLPADLARAFGQAFFDSLFEPTPYAPQIRLAGSRRLAFVTAGSVPDYRPIVEFAEADDGYFYAVRLKTVDTLFPFGSGSLERLSRTFLGAGKFPGFTPEEKARMLEMFRDRPHDAFGYAYRDAALTLLVNEQMQRQDRAMYESMGIPEEITPPMRPTVGGRVSSFLVAATRQFAGDSKILGNNRSLKFLMRAGGLQRFAPGADGSHFGEQTGAVHGGLLLNRTATKLWHDAPGQLRDVDMRGCYSEILQRKNAYWGRPVLFEPGARRMTLRQAVRFVRQQADDDAWFIRVTGDITTMPNVLIPSTIGAVTGDNYRRKRRRRLAPRQRRKPGPRFRAKLFSQRIESGVVTMDTWGVIQAFPQRCRREYENLLVDAIIFYPRSLVASSGPAYDQKFEQFHEEGLPWSAKLDPKTSRIIETIKLDHEFIALKFPIGSYARRIEDLRREARRTAGSGSGQELAFKLQVNSMFGVVASEHCVVNNTVLANQITAQARAEAFVMTMSLNALQTNTDGCTYRADRIPSCTFAECLRRQPDYPLHHTDETSRIPFYDPAEIPQDDAAFAKWYPTHVQTFLDISSEAASRILIHQLEHKPTGDTGSPAFDGLACDGSANHIKVIKSGSGWMIKESKMRGCGERSKTMLAPWVVQTYSSDKLRDLAPVTCDSRLLKLKEAAQAARRMLRNQDIMAVLLPLGFEETQTKAYSVLRPSAFVFQTPRQLAAIERQVEKLRRTTGVGLDMLALRRSYDGRLGGSLSDVARRLYEYFQAGGRDLSKAFNLREDRRSETMKRGIRRRQQTLESARSDARERLEDLMIVESESPDPFTPGIVLTQETAQCIVLENA